MRIERLAEEAGCTDLQVWTLAQLAKGRSIKELAEERGVLERGVWNTRRSALERISRHEPFKPTSRHLHVVGLRKEGHSWDYIAVEMRTSSSTAQRLYKQAIDHSCIQ